MVRKFLPKIESLAWSYSVWNGEEPLWVRSVRRDCGPIAAALNPLLAVQVQATSFLLNSKAENVLKIIHLCLIVPFFKPCRVTLSFNAV